MSLNINNNSLEILEWNEVLVELAKLCTTELGKQSAIYPEMLEEEEIRIQLLKISEIKSLLIEGENPVFSGITNIEPNIQLVEKGATLSLEDLGLIKSFLIASDTLHTLFKTNRDLTPNLSNERNDLNELKELRTLLNVSITENDELNDKQFPELRKINSAIISARQEIEKRLNHLINSESMSKVIQERSLSTRNERYVILVKSGMRSRIKGTIHDISATGQTTYFEPEAVNELNSRLILLKRELRIEIEKILQTLSASVSDYSTEIIENLHIITYLDFITGAAKFSIKLKANAPLILDEPIIDVYQARHPLLYLMKGDEVVPNDIELGKSYTGLVLSGANTGGKTVLLKTIGLITLMAKHGLHIPAEADSSIGIFSNIYADIGDDQNLEESLSTFSGQLTFINEVLQNGDDRSIAIIDEIIVGTNPRQGAALSQAILEEMIEIGCKIVVTTHYSELKELGSSNSKFENGSVSFDLETLHPTYRLKMGIPGVSYAFEIAKNYGLTGPILDRSKDLIEKREQSMEALLEKVQKYEEGINEERDKIKQIKYDLEKKETKLKEREVKLDSARNELKKEKGIEFIEELNSYRSNISKKISDLQNMSQQEMGKLQSEIISLESSVSKKLKTENIKTHKSKYKPIDEKTVKIGDEVFVPNLEKNGIIEEIQKNRATILLGQIRSRYKLSELMKIEKPESQEKKTKNKSSKKVITGTIEESIVPPTIQTQYNTIDLRGKRADEALSKMDSDLDKMSTSGVSTVVIIHGHGTGALKKAVRDQLKFSIYISNSRPGEQNEGGDGVTIVLLR